MEAKMSARIRMFLLFEALTFVAASLVHFGVLVHGYEHDKARIAEGVIAAVLLAGLIVSLARPVWTAEAGVAGQSFALLGTFVGVFTIIVGVGPRTLPDLIYHGAIIAILAWGLKISTEAMTSSSLSLAKGEA
jgi:hypothetical protein